MICEECKKLGIKSRVYSGVSSSTAKYCPSFYDEDGKYHAHDSNVIVTSYECSNGHKFSLTNTNSCPSCEWPNKG